MRVFIKILQVFEAKIKYHRDSWLAIIAHPQYQTFLDHAMRVFIKILQVPYLRPRPNIMDRWLAIHFFSSLPSSKTLI
jgi:hypothetical protein